ncbi:MULTISPECIES: iron-containing alcohol dehydrogenase PsrA [Variovorax]|jgi:phosphonate metabolism-associated iron-containing alcohol dehydrogenase|uniref:iron-containing alcohol dehydrogenase PsrA n=1 Tax=Variovorax TaxID=34072 RepID=UPI001604137E|nr:iron-containing alcohol dehydrogenase PsrA [Variovorax sp. UMC13]MBB1601469.1 alcohol dehydrogenase [Variovorax sp. UMC13]
MNAHYFNPVHSVYGAGALSSLPELLDGRRAAVVTFPEARALGLVARLEAVLGDRLACVIDCISPNPDVQELSQTYEDFWRTCAEVEVIVAVGGGSAIDTAKALMVADESGRFDALVSGLAGEKPFTPTRFKRLIAVPTTAGTGSEVTPWATIWDRARQKKHSLHLPQTWPEYAVIDPELMLSLPASVTLQSGLDALSHALESIWNVNANPLSDTMACSAVHEILAVLPALMQQPQDLGLRGRMALAALQAGMAFSNTKTALAHSISYEMTLRYGLPHGIACSFSLPMVLRSAIGQRADRDAVLERALGAPLAEAPERLERFIEGLGVKTRFGDYGVSAQEARAMVLHAQGGARGKNFIGRPTPTETLT